jgi:DNA-binding beta-propeller fold protein YncE
MACSDSSYEMKADSGYATAGDYAGGEGEGESEAADSDEYAPEAEDAYATLPPATTDAYVFVANPDRNTVTRVSVSDLSVITTEVGVDPHVVKTTEDFATTVVFNRGTDDLSIIDSESLSVATVEVEPNFNQMVMSPDGRWVACYFDAATADSADISDEATRSYNSISLVNIETREHIPMVAGFNPRDIRFNSRGDRMVVVSDSYLAVVDLDAESPAPTRIAIAEDILDPPVAEEVLLTPSGDQAVIRQFGATSLVVADLDEGTVDLIDVGENPTDLDITPDGDFAVVVARGSNELWIYDLKDVFEAPEVIAMPEGEVLGSVVMSPDNRQGLLYSTASGVSRYSSWDRRTGEIEVHPAVKPVSGVKISPDGGVALLVHDQENGDVDSESPFWNQDAITLVELDSFFPNPIVMPSAPTEFASTAEGDLGYVILEDERIMVEFDYNTLIHDEIVLKSNAVHIGLLPETRTIYASQEHDLGRISFYNADNGDLQTVTGFELNSAIEVNR